MGYNPQESRENRINTMGTQLGVHPIVHWMNWDNEDVYVPEIENKRYALPS